MDREKIMQPCEGVTLATVMARKGVSAARIGASLGLSAPEGPHYRSSGALGLVGTGPGSWLAICESDEGRWPDRLERALSGLASVSDQSSGYALFRFTGPQARTLLQRGAPIDLDPASFSVGAAVGTVIAHMSVILWQVDDKPTFNLAIFRSLKESFEHWASVAAHGL